MLKQYLLIDWLIDYLFPLICSVFYHYVFCISDLFIRFSYINSHSGVLCFTATLLLGSHDAQTLLETMELQQSTVASSWVINRNKSFKNGQKRLEIKITR